jgi:hypothetical protein
MSLRTRSECYVIALQSAAASISYPGDLTSKLQNQYVTQRKYNGYFVVTEIVVLDDCGWHFLETCLDLCW